MKHYSKMVALLLALIMAVMPGVVSASNDVNVTTGSGAALGSSIDLAQKVLNVNFTGTVDEAKLADGVKVYENASTEKILHIAKSVQEPATVEYEGGFAYYQPETAFEGGTLNISFSLKNTENRYFTMYLRRKNTDGTYTPVERFGIDGSNWYKYTTSGNASQNPLPAAVGDTKGKWVDVEMTINLDSPKFWFSVDGNRYENDWGHELGFNKNPNDGYFNIGRISIGADDNKGTVADVSVKNFKLTHTTTQGTTVYAPNYSKATGETGFDFTYGAAANTNGYNTITVEEALAGNEVTMTPSYADGTYTLTKADNWDVTKTYTLWVSKDINGAAADTVYNFTATDLGGIKAVTVDGEELGEEIDLTQKEIKVEFANDVTESALDDGVKVLTDVANKKVLHMTAASDAGMYGVSMQKNVSAYTSGTVTFNYSFKYTGDRYPETYIRTSSGTYLEGFRVYSTEDGANKYMVSIKETGDQNISGVTENVKGRWVDVEVIVDLDASPKCYTFKVDGVTVRENEQFKTGVEVTDVGQFLFLGGQNAAGEVDIMWKDIKITHKASESAAPTVIEATGTDFFSSTNSCTVTEEDIMTGVEVEMNRSYDAASKTYTLTNAGDWDASKEYKLVIDKDVIGASQDAEYDFVARNLFGSLTLDSVTAASGAALEDGGYLSAAEEGINLKFSDSVATSSLSGIKLEKINTEKVLHMTAASDAGMYGVSMQKNVSAYTSGTVTFNYSFKYTGDRYPETYIRTSSSTYLEGFRVYSTEDGANKYMVSIKETGDQNISGVTENVKGRWVDVEVIVDLDASPKCYTFKVDGVTVRENEQFKTGVEVTDVGQFQFLGGQNAAGAVDIMWKDIKITHKASESAAPTVIEANDASFFTISGCTVTTKDYENLTNVDVEYANDTTTNTVTVIPEAALEYLGNYKLTVPTTVATDNGANLLAGDVINFTAIYDDALYSAAAGFKAGAEELTEISSTFTGDITGWAHITNITSTPKSADLIVALYLNDRLVDTDIVPVTDIAGGTTKTDAYGTVTIAADKASAGYKAAVFVWDSITGIYPVATKITTK